MIAHELIEALCKQGSVDPSNITKIEINPERVVFTSISFLRLAGRSEISETVTTALLCNCDHTPKRADA